MGSSVGMLTRQWVSALVSRGWTNNPSLVCGKDREREVPIAGALWGGGGGIQWFLFVSAHTSPNSAYIFIQAWCQPRPYPWQHLQDLCTWGFTLSTKEAQLSCKQRKEESRSAKDEHLNWEVQLWIKKKYRCWEIYERVSEKYPHTHMYIL